jgi:hypothetical protein
VITDPQMISFGLNIGIRNLIVEKLSAFGTAFDPPGVVIQQASQEPEAFVLRKNVDLNKIGELPDTTSRTPRLWLKLKPIQARHMSVRPPDSLRAEFPIACATEGSAGTSRRGLRKSSRV